jgi:hypothetical protein
MSANGTRWSQTWFADKDNIIEDPCFVYLWQETPCFVTLLDVNVDFYTTKCHQLGSFAKKSFPSTVQSASASFSLAGRRLVVVGGHDS